MAFYNGNRRRRTRIIDRVRRRANRLGRSIADKRCRQHLIERDLTMDIGVAGSMVLVLGWRCMILVWHIWLWGMGDWGFRVEIHLMLFATVQSHFTCPLLLLLLTTPFINGRQLLVSIFCVNVSILASLSNILHPLLLFFHNINVNFHDLQQQTKRNGVNGKPGRSARWRSMRWVLSIHFIS